MPSFSNIKKLFSLPWWTATEQPCPSQYTNGFSFHPCSSEHTQHPPTISRSILHTASGWKSVVAAATCGHYFQISGDGDDNKKKREDGGVVHLTPRGLTSGRIPPCHSLTPYVRVQQGVGGDPCTCVFIYQQLNWIIHLFITIISLATQKK